MQAAQEEDQHERRLKSFASALESGTLASVRMMLNGLHPAEIGHLLESLPPAQRTVLWELVDKELDGDVLLYVNDELRAALIHQMQADELVAAAEGLEMDDLADILKDLPDAVIQEVLQSMDEQNRERLQSVLSYPEDTAGGLMNTDTITVRPDVTLDVVLRYLRRRGELPETTDMLFVVNRDGGFMGKLNLAVLLTRAPELTVAEVMSDEVESIKAKTPANEVASLFEHRDLVSAPVVGENNRLLGRITIDDVVDVIRDEAEHSLMSMAGVAEEEDMFAPVIVSARHRAVWLGINLFTAFVASWVIGIFEATIEKVVALAVLMPIVASMGGIAGSQTLTLVIRGIALGQIGTSNARRLIVKEVGVAMLNGIIWSLVVAAIVVMWFGNYQMGMVIAAAIIINLLIAALAGATIPMMLRRMGADPALGGSVMLTTVTDVIGFMAFLGLATIFLL